MLVSVLSHSSSASSSARGPVNSTSVGEPTVGSQWPAYPPSTTSTVTVTGSPSPTAEMREPTCWNGTPSLLRSAAPQTRPS